MWSYHKDCFNFIKTVWSNQIFGSPMQILCKKLKILKDELKIWNKNDFGNIQNQVSNAVNKLNEIQQKIHDDGYTDCLMSQENLAKVELEAVLNMEEAYWHEKARVKWHNEGDRNTAFFHRTCKIKQAYKRISAIRIDDVITTEPDLITSHVVNHFQNLFTCDNAILDNGLIEEVIPELVTIDINSMLTLLPSLSEIHNAVFSLNKDGAPGPDGFGAFFFQTYWNIVKDDVSNAVLEFFSTNWLMPNYNSNTVVLIPKVQNADSIGQYRPIAIANFKFKIISKILADRLALILPNIISKEQRGFIKGRQIKDCVCLTSEAINMLHNKAYGGNLAIKIDIAKAFDTLDWQFLLKVLKTFGFCEKFCNWIQTILHSAKLSISINGKHEGFFSCARGVRQGDPLSPLLFCIAEEVLSRGLSKLVSEDKLKPLNGTRNVSIPSHILYADDVMLFCKGTSSNIEVLSSFFARYAQISGQYINPHKSTIFAGSITHTKLTSIASSLGFCIGTLPFMYLGVPIFKGKPKAVYFQPLVDKVKMKLASWKASLLTYAGRIQLVKSVIHSMLVYSITTYSWPISLIKMLDRYMRNFIWSGDLLVRKLVTVSWNKMCSPIDEGGLGIRSLSNLNKASNLKLFWELFNSDNQWANLLRSRVVRKNGFIKHHIYSSLWSGIKNQDHLIAQNTRWLVGNGNNINFWLHNWSGVQLVNFLQIPQHLHHFLHAKVSDFILNHQWIVPLDLQAAYPTLLPYLNQFTIPLEDKEDKLIWIHNAHGELTLKDAYSFFTTSGQKVSWAKSLWNIAIPPSKSFMVWRLFHHKMPTDEILAARGIQLPSMCCLCNKDSETTNHLFLECQFSLALWNWLAAIINHRIDVSSLSTLWQVTSGNWNPQCKITITAVVIYILNYIWLSRNNLRFKNIKPNFNSITSLIIANVSLVGNCSRLTAGSSITDFEILKFFKIEIHQSRPAKIVEVLWSPPLNGWYKCNTDGTSMGNPGPAACAGVFRNYKGEFLGCFAKNLGIANALFAEIMGVIIAIECAFEKNWKQLWLECDSKLVVLAFKSPHVIPWQLKNRWLNCITKIKNMSFCISHIYREGNHCADKLASFGLALNDYAWWNISPIIIREDLDRNRLGLPFFRIC
ncbi:unnamed protein product [Trifolium pratense]|uniref:Uncharacterized protein n=1 Tax=Trifolium pratense TaxID=57577 RepID=A0ACB0JKH3_TRIPR|nr:unnamed protein product [Trifolium pratense]